MGIAWYMGIGMACWLGVTILEPRPPGGLTPNTGPGESILLCILSWPLLLLVTLFLSR